MESTVPEQFKQIEMSSTGLDYYSLAYYAYFKLLDNKVITYQNKITGERFRELLEEGKISLDNEDFRNLCSTIRGSQESESLFGIYKERENSDYKVDLLRLEKKQMPGDDEEKFYVWIQLGDNIRGFNSEGNYKDDFEITIQDHVEWNKENPYGDFMRRVTSDKAISNIFEGNLETFRDNPEILDYVNTQRDKIVSYE